MTVQVNIFFPLSASEVYYFNVGDTLNYYSYHTRI